MTTVMELRGAASLEGERRLLDDTARRRGVLLRQRLTSAVCISLFEVALERVRLAIALGARQEADAALRDACAWACAAELGARFERGDAVIAFAGETTCRVAADAARLTLPQWIDALALACIARDRAALALFADADLVAMRAAQLGADAPAVGTEPFWLPYGRAFAHLVAGDPRAAEEASLALDRLHAPSPIDPANLEAVDRPVLEGIVALAQGERAGWSTRAARALEAFHGYYARPEFDRLVPGYAAIGLLAICVLARERGIDVRIDSPYVRADWLGGVPPGRAAHLEFHCPPLAARDAAEIRWWLDLAGVPPADRAHRLAAEDGRLVAAYEARFSAAGPRVLARFAIDERAAPLLDAGELVLASDLHARRVPGTADRLHLREAIAALDALDARRRGDGEIDASGTSARGERLRATQPGRFERRRLQALRAEYARQLQDGRPRPTREEHARAGALVGHALVAARLAPLLDRLAGAAPRDIEQLRPRPDDYARAFMPQALDAARAAYEALWGEGLDIEAPEHASCAGHVHVAPAGMLASDNALSRPFPGGYRAVAPLLQPQRVWACWRYARPGERPAIAYDGLVWCDDHWAWFPKPYRALAALARRA